MATPSCSRPAVPQLSVQPDPGLPRAHVPAASSLSAASSPGSSGTSFRSGSATCWPTSSTRTRWKTGYGLRTLLGRAQVASRGTVQGGRTLLWGDSLAPWGLKVPFLLPQVSTMAEMKSYSQAVTGVSTARAYVCVCWGGCVPPCVTLPRGKNAPRRSRMTLRARGLTTLALPPCSLALHGACGKELPSPGGALGIF